MQKSSTLYLQAVIVLIAIAALVFLLWEPQLEGRNVNATLFAIYFNDPFLAFAYIASIPFFVALFQAFKVLGYIRQERTFSQATVHAFLTIRFCAIAIIGFVVIGAIMLLSGESADRPPVILMSMLAIGASSVVATASAMFERIVQKVVAH